MVLYSSEERALFTKLLTQFTPKVIPISINILNKYYKIMPNLKIIFIKFFQQNLQCYKHQKLFFLIS